MIAEYKLSLKPRTLDDAEGAARPLLQAAQDSLGFVPNMYTTMANAPAMLSTYLHGYQQFRENSGFSPAEQEVVLLTISRFNGCSYCMAAHSMIADKMSNVPAPVLSALREDREIADPKLGALSRFTVVMMESRGLPNREDVDTFLHADFREEHILQIVLAIAVKTISNYSNHVTQPAVDDAFASYTWED